MIGFAPPRKRPRKNMPHTQQSVDDYVAKYRNKADVLKKIHSRKAESNHRWDLIHTLATLILGATITFLGFMGPDKLADVIRPAWFSVAALLLFITSLLNLIYRWKEEYVQSFQAVVRLTTYINWLDELIFFGLTPNDIDKLCEIRNRYQCIVENLPPNADKDYRRVKTSSRRN